MPADTRKAKRDDDDDAVRPKGKSHLSEVGSENAAGSKKSETLSRNNQSLNSGNSIQKSHKRFKSANEPAKEVEQRGKLESNASSQRKKTLRAHIYRDRFRAHTTKVKASEGVKLQVPSKDLVSGTEVLVSETMNGGKIRDSTVSSQQKEKVAEGMLVQEGYDKQPEKKKLKYINKIKRRFKNLYDRQSNEEEELQKQKQARKAELEKSYKLESNVIHSILINSSQAMRNDRLKILEANHRQKLDELDSEMDFELKAMKARHQTEIEEEEKEGIRKMKEWIENGLFDDRQSKEGFRIEEVVPIKSCSLEEENANVHRSAELHNDTAENSGSVEVAAIPTMCGNGAISKSPNAIQVNNEATTSANVGKRTEDSLGVQENNNHAESAVAAEEVEQIATSKNDQLSTEIPTFQTEVDVNEASERDPSAGTEQNEGAGCSAHIESMNSPSTVNPSLVQPVTNQHQADSLPVSQENAISCARLIQLNNEDVRAETSGMNNEMIQDNPAARTEQNEEAGCSAHIESMNSPSTVNPSLVQPVTNQHQSDSLPVSQENAISCARLLQLNNEDVRAEISGMHNEMIQDIMPSSVHSDGIPCNAPEQALYSPAVPLDTGVSCSTSCDLPENQLMTESSLPPEAPVPFQEDRRPLNRWVEAPPPCPSLDASPYNPPLLNSSQFDSYMASRSVLPRIISQEFDPLVIEFERIGGESNQVSKNHEDMVGRLKSECDKEIEDIVGEIRSKYESRVQEAEASFIQKKKEMDRNQWKVGMNIKLAEAFRRKCIVHRTEQQAAAAAGLTQQQRQLLLNSHQFSRSMVATRPMSSVLPL